MNLLLVHGALGTGSQLAPLKSHLAGVFQVQMAELEGHGSTPSTATHYSIERFVENLRALIIQRAIAPVAVFGYSMGGYAALKLAADDPALVGAVITLGTKLEWNRDIAARETGKLNPLKIRAKVPAFAEELERRHSALPGGWESVLEKTADLMTKLGERPLIDAEAMSRVEQPVRLMVGDRDAVVSVEETVSSAQKLPRGEYAVVPATPHPFEQARPQLIAELIEDFLVPPTMAG